MESANLLQKMQILLDQNPSLQDKVNSKLTDLLNEIDHIQQEENLPLSLRRIKNLKDLNFYVDSYQRGYKWTVHQVKALLDDIHDFTVEEPDDYYCLQPIVVKKRMLDGAEFLELIDGQQRMTTIYLILAYLEKHSFFHIEYQTRKGSAVFLKEHVFKLKPFHGLSFNDYIHSCPQLNNIDNYHFFNAFQYIHTWFSEKEVQNSAIRDQWLKKLLKHCKVIWYKVENQFNDADDRTQSIQIFQRLNQGKISLTNAELLKALFLHHLQDEVRPEVFKIKQSEMANQWDMMEHKLQDADFWAFVCPHNQNNLYTRIELLFDLLSEKYDYSNNKNSSEKKLEKKQEYYTFQHFLKKVTHENLKHQGVISQLWKQIQQGFYRLNEWFENDNLYHLIGFIVGEQIRSITELWKIAHAVDSRSAFENRLKEIVAQHICKSFGFKFDSHGPLDVFFEDLNYGENNKEIKSLLLLLNIDLHRQQRTRFPFKSFYNPQAKWSLEHIHARNSKDLPKEQIQHWLDEQEDLLAHLSTEAIIDSKKAELYDALNQYKTIKNQENLESYVNLQDQYLNEYLEQYKHRLDNLCLLGQRENSKISNETFYSKRQIVMEMLTDEQRYIPLATQWVFSKFYNPQPKNLSIWGEEDRKTYRAALVRCWKYYDLRLFKAQNDTIGADA